MPKQSGKQAEPGLPSWSLGKPQEPHGKKGETKVPSEQAVLKRLRAICRQLPEVIETTTFGHPTFQAGKKKTFVVLDDHECDDALCIVFKASPSEQKELIKQLRFFPSKFGAKHGWTSMKVDDALDWKQVESLITKSYRLLANQRMLIALDNSSTRRANSAKR